MYIHVYTCTHTHTRAHTTLLSLPYTHARAHVTMDPRHRIGLKTMIIKSMTSDVNCASDSFVSLGLSVSDSQELAVNLNLLEVKQYLSTRVYLPGKFHVSISKHLPVRACVCLFDLLEVKQYLLTCVCLPDKFHVSISKCLPLRVRVFVY